jgi:para-aminobenzoate synthetase/4-amino-4-deoxychorismate lyase
MPPETDAPNVALMRAPAEDCWYLFCQPLEVLQAARIEEIEPLMARLEQALAGSELCAAGYLAYEAAGGFDPALKTRELLSIPLAWFGLYPPPLRLAEPPAAPDADPGPLQSWQPSADRAEYDRAIAAIKEYIARGATYQVNYTFRLNAPFTASPYAAFLELARAQNAPYAAYLNTPEFAICSASPELFFQLDGEHIHSIPMKGTAARGRTLAEDREKRDWLRASKKDQAENVMIVDMVRNDIGRIARTGSVRVPELFGLEKFPTVWQMVSTVSGETGAGYAEIFRALFPPASITGAPKPRTMQIIAELESKPRGVYTGALGFILPRRKAQFNVAIRTLLVDRRSGRAEYGVGGGITWDSLDTAEYEECRAKARILSTRIPPFHLLESLRWSPAEGYFLREHHLRRLSAAAEYFAYPLDLEEVRRELERLAQGFDPRQQAARKVRLLVDRRGGITLQAETLPTPPTFAPLAARVCLAAAPVDSSDPFLYHKTTHRAVYDLARREAGEGWDDVLLYNERGELTETCTANIVLELDGVCLTPPVSSGLLAGTYRGWLLEQGRLEERVLRPEDLARGRLFLINSVRKERPALLEK